jgi:hypothetical protein
VLHVAIQVSKGYRLEIIGGLSLKRRESLVTNSANSVAFYGPGRHIYRVSDAFSASELDATAALTL